MELAEIIIKSGRDYQLLRGHPWIFSGAIVGQVDTEIGDIVRIKSQTGEFLGYGFYEGRSIAVKVIAAAKTQPDTEYWRACLQRAIEFRKFLRLPEPGVNDAYRLVHAEGDGIPGLIVDIYGSVAVVEFHGAGPRKLRATWQDLLLELLPGLQKVFFRDELEADQGESHAPVTISENSRKIRVALDGQKTGYFLDQAWNRELVKNYSAGRRVLDCFSYSGGFTVAALAGGCRSVTSVDSSDVALKLLSENVQLNFDLSAIVQNSIKADCLKWLQNTTEKYDLIILDPPAFIKQRAALRGGLAGYQTINRLGFEKLSPGGLLFTFSCSQLVSAGNFEELVMEAAVRAGRRARVVQHLEQAPSHSYSLFHLEGRYLKGLLIYVE